MAQNKETSIGIRLVSDLRNYQKNLTQGQKETRKFKQNVKREVGEVGQAFQQLMRGDITALPDFFRAATTSAKGFAGGLKAVKAALIATGIGAILVGLGTAIAALTQYFKGTEEGQIAFKKVMNNIKAYTEPVLQMFGNFGKAIMQLFKGDFQGAWETAKGAVKGVGDQIKENKSNVDELNAAEEKYIQLKRRTLLENKQLEAEIAEARRIGNDEENYTAQQRKKALDEAIAKQKQLAANKREELNLETYIAETKASFGDNDIETNNQLNDLKVRQFEITREQEMAIKRIGEDQQRVTRELNAQIAKQAIINQQIAERAANSGISTITTRTNFEMGDAPDLGTDQLDDMGNRIAATTAKAQEMNAAFAASDTIAQKMNAAFAAIAQEMNAAFAAIASEENQEAIGMLSQQFNQLGGAIGGTAGHFLNLGSTMLELIPQLISQIAGLTSAQVASSQSIAAAKGSEAIASGTAASQSVPFPLNLIALAVTIGSIIAALAKKPPKMAAGGLVYGDSLVNVGEYANARVNPEVIAPLDKLQGIMDKRQPASQTQVFIPETRLKGEDIVISYNRASSRVSKRT